MDIIKDAIELLLDNYSNSTISTRSIFSMLLMITALSVYLFVVYRLVSKRTFYNKSFHITITVIPYFIGVVIMCLQTNAVVTLGTIGALAMVRFRTAIKDPVDMIYILWSIFVGITCGCRLYEICVLTTLMVTIVLLLINLVSNIIKPPFCLIIHTLENKEDELNEIITANTKKFHIKSRNFNSRGVNYVYEITAKDIQKLLSALSDCTNIDNFSLIDYDAEDIM